MKIDRLMGIITLLLRKDRVTAPELAERFEVSRRTINRDIEDICRAGIPVVTAQGFGGGISISEGYTIDKSLFTQEELQALFAGIQSIDSVSEYTDTGTLLNKLAEQRKYLVADNYLIIDLVSYYKDSLAEKFDVIRRAIVRHRGIAFSYFYSKGESRFTLEPYRLIFKWSSWYVFGFCPERNDFRFFKLNRLLNIDNTKESFVPRILPAGALRLGDCYLEERYRIKAVFDPSVKYRLIEEYGPDSFTVREDGKLFFERAYTFPDNMREWILSFGDKVYVEEPVELRVGIARIAENLLASYREHDT